MEKTQTQEEQVRLVRILGNDIEGDKNVFEGLRKIKGVSWSFSNAVCKKLNFENKKIGELSEEDVNKIVELFSSTEIPSFLKNRQKDFDSGEDKHLHGSDLSLRKDFDLKRMRKTKSYRGLRHAAGLPVRGQRTKANFRKNKKKSGVVGVKGKGK